MAMHYQGFDVVVYEKVGEFGRLGDSLGLGENALKLLKRWGMKPNRQADCRGGSTDCCYWKQVAHDDYTTMV
jgi:2-polyprenyl-6-methoxyphenol hydroxylase-like FAD-dependent oxidoreductase